MKIQLNIRNATIELLNNVFVNLLIVVNLLLFLVKNRSYYAINLNVPIKIELMSILLQFQGLLRCSKIQTKIIITLNCFFNGLIPISELKIALIHTLIR